MISADSRPTSATLKPAKMSTDCRRTLSRLILGSLVVALVAGQQVTSTSRADVRLARRQVNEAGEATTATQHVFPGVSRDVATFCAARPSMPIDLSTMVVHVKKNSSFNYKLYLFSADNVFQTGQVVPRDDFRIHTFPVKLSKLDEFWPEGTDTTAASATQQLDSSSSSSSDSHSLGANDTERAGGKRVSGGKSFNLKQFLKSVPLNPFSHSANGSARHTGSADKQESETLTTTTTTTTKPTKILNRAEREHNLNHHIQFDRDDQVSALNRIPSEQQPADNQPADSAPTASGARRAAMESADDDDNNHKRRAFAGDLILPVGSFSSFRVNETYLARKDFGDREAQVVKIAVDADRFKVTQVRLIAADDERANSDLDFLSHKILRDPNTRITAINQVYEQWITRNFYTIVYVQRKLDAGEKDEQLVSDRLVFRGSSVALIGADQLDYSVKAAAFITEKNGLHYYLEFLPTGKFYLCAIDWTKRPFKIIDSRSFPLKHTRTELDNEELLLCPPAACYSSRPVDEIVAYGRLDLSEQSEHEASILAKSSWSAGQQHTHHSSSPESTSGANTSANDPADELLETLPTPQHHLGGVDSSASRRPTLRARRSLDLHTDDNLDISLDSVSEAVRRSASHLQVRLHLRDWVWVLPRQRRRSAAGEQAAGWFTWRYESAQRNVGALKVTPDTYGYALTGQEVDAAYRVYNELHVISSNHLITVNHSSFNETNVSKKLVSQEFSHLSSTLIDPITGAFYDRYSNNIYFFKGDRYVGYDYATKKPLQEFLLSPDEMMDHSSDQKTASLAPLVFSLPVESILGRQHQVDGVYHDLSSDLVHIFTGMKFYTFEANEFKNGTFKHQLVEKLPPMLCINQHFLSGCNFDKAFPNPCDSNPEGVKATKSAGDASDFDGKKDDKIAVVVDELDHYHQQVPGDNADQAYSVFKLNEVDAARREPPTVESPPMTFNERQQMKLRLIASGEKLLNFLAEENTRMSKLNAKFRARDNNNHDGFSVGSEYSRQEEKIVIYLLVTMVVITIIVTVAMMVVLLNWTKVKLSKVDSQQRDQMLGGLGDNRHLVASMRRQMQSHSPSMMMNYQQQQQQHLQQQQHYRSSTFLPPPIRMQSHPTNNNLHHHHHHNHHQQQQLHVGYNPTQMVRKGLKPLDSINVDVLQRKHKISLIDNSVL